MSNPLPVYLVDRIPGAEGRSVKWTDICRQRDKVFVTYEEFRDTGRWTHVERGRKFIVYSGDFASPMSSHYTLEAAEKAAAKLAKMFAN